MSTAPESEASLRRMMRGIGGPVYTPELRLETVSKLIVRERKNLARLENLQKLLENDLAVINLAEGEKRYCLTCELGSKGNPLHHVCKL